jgi:hypothetical protein
MSDYDKLQQLKEDLSTTEKYGPDEDCPTNKMWKGRMQELSKEIRGLEIELGLREE